MSLSDYTYRNKNLVPRVRFSLPLEVGCPTSKAREKRPGDRVGRIIAAPRLIASLDRIITPLDGNIDNNRLPRIISHSDPSRHLFFFFIPSLSRWSGVWSSKTDQWGFKLWRLGYWHRKLIKEPNLEHLESLRSVYLILMWSFFDLMG